MGKDQTKTTLDVIKIIYTNHLCLNWNLYLRNAKNILYLLECGKSTRSRASLPSTVLLFHSASLTQSKWDQAENIVNFIFYSARCRSKINIIVSADVEFVKCFIKERFSTWNLSNFEFVKSPNLLNFTRETCLNCNIFFATNWELWMFNSSFWTNCHFFDVFKYKLTPFILEKTTTSVA